MGLDSSPGSGDVSDADVYRVIFESLDDVFYRIDRVGMISLVSPSSLLQTGYAACDLTGTNISRFWRDPGHRRLLLRALRSSDLVTDFETELVRRNGEIAPVAVNVRARRNPAGDLIGFEGTIRDSAGRKSLQLERDRFFLRSVDMLAVTDAHGRLFRVNPSWTSTLGYSPDELIGQSLWHFVLPDDRAEGIRAVRQAGTEAGEGRDVRLRFVRKDGTILWLSWSFADSVESGLVYCVIRDVTELVETQLEMNEALTALRVTAAALEKQMAVADQLREEAEFLAHHDVLTGVKNRRAWMADSLRMRPTAIAMFDVDHFKTINDAYGHPVGDEVLIIVAQRIQSALPPSASLGRVGGEEFAVALDIPFPDAVACIKAACEAVSEEVCVALADGRQIRVTVSVGEAPWQPSGTLRETSLSVTYACADGALYDAKKSGRDRCVVYEATQLPVRTAA